MAVAELSRALLVPHPDGLELLEEQGEVADFEVGAQRAGGPGALQEASREVVRRASGTVQLLVGAEGAGEAHGQRTGAGIETGTQKLDEGGPRVTVVDQCGLSRCDVELQSIEAQTLEQRVLAGVSAVEGADAHPCPCGDQGDGSAGVGDEDSAGRLDDASVVAGRLSASATQRRGGM